MNGHCLVLRYIDAVREFGDKSACTAPQCGDSRWGNRTSPPDRMSMIDSKLLCRVSHCFSEGPIDCQWHIWMTCLHDRTRDPVKGRDLANKRKREMTVFLCWRASPASCPPIWPALHEDMAHLPERISAIASPFDQHCCAYPPGGTIRLKPGVGVRLAVALAPSVVTPT